MHGRIIVFAREPIAGCTKTRLHPALGPEGAAALSRKLIRHTLDKASAARADEVVLYASDPVDKGFLAECAMHYGIPLRTQAGSDLGQRMNQAFQHELATADWVVLVGTDCPSMLPEDIEQAESALREGCDAVIGPALDGGYYLLGLRRCNPSLFTGIEWGTEAVYTQTKNVLDGLGFGVLELPARRDIDTPDDLAFLPAQWA
mgnify:FL=1